MDLPPIAREKTLGAHAYDEMKRALMTGVFKPNQKTTIRAAAAALQVSITPARDALSRLIAEGALESKGPKTIIVPPLTYKVLKEITRVRIALEGLAAETAAPDIGEADIRELEAIQERLNEAMDAEDYTTVLTENETFHFNIYRKADMPRLTSFIESLWLRIGPSLNLLYPEFAVRKQGVQNHIDVIGGLRRGEPAVVRAAIEKDIRDGFDSLSKVVMAQQTD